MLSPQLQLGQLTYCKTPIIFPSLPSPIPLELVPQNTRNEMIERGGESLQKNNFFKEITTEEKKGKGGKSSYARQARLEAMTAHPKP
jgi:hypothetical protein